MRPPTTAPDAVPFTMSLRPRIYSTVHASVQCEYRQGTVFERMHEGKSANCFEGAFGSREEEAEDCEVFAVHDRAKPHLLKYIAYAWHFAVRRQVQRGVERSHEDAEQ